MAAIISRRLRLTTPSLLLRPSHSHSSSSTNLLLFNNNPQPPIFEPPFTASSHFFSQSTTTLPKPTITTSHYFNVVGSGPFSMNPFVPPCSCRFLSTGDSSSEKPPSEIHPRSEKRDLSPLANGTREALEGMMKILGGLRRAMEFVGLVQVCIALCFFAMPFPIADQTLSLLGSIFGFTVVLPLWLTHVLSQSLKPTHHLKKMEMQGRLQSLPFTLQVAKHLNDLFVVLRRVNPFLFIAVGMGYLVTRS